MDEGDVRSLVTAHEAYETPDTDQQNPMFRQMDMANNYYGQQMHKRISGGKAAARLFSADAETRKFVDDGKACVRKRGDPSRQPYTGGFENPTRCGLG